jgi:Ribonuclease G/E
VIDGLMGRRVDLPSGGYLMIDYAEALTVIDVNSARSSAAASRPGWRTRSSRRTSRRLRGW